MMKKYANITKEDEICGNCADIWSNSSDTKKMMKNNLCFHILIV